MPNTKLWLSQKFSALIQNRDLNDMFSFLPQLKKQLNSNEKALHKIIVLSKTLKQKIDLFNKELPLLQKEFDHLTNTKIKDLEKKYASMALAKSIETVRKKKSKSLPYNEREYGSLATRLKLLKEKKEIIADQIENLTLHPSDDDSLSPKERLSIIKKELENLNEILSSTPKKLLKITKTLEEINILIAKFMDDRNHNYESIGQNISLEGEILSFQYLTINYLFGLIIDACYEYLSSEGGAQKSVGLSKSAPRPQIPALVLNFLQKSEENTQGFQVLIQLIQKIAADISIDQKIECNLCHLSFSENQIDFDVIFEQQCWPEVQKATTICNSCSLKLYQIHEKETIMQNHWYAEPAGEISTSICPSLFYLWDGAMVHMASITQTDSKEYTLELHVVPLAQLNYIPSDRVQRLLASLSMDSLSWQKLDPFQKIRLYVDETTEPAKIDVFPDIQDACDAYAIPLEAKKGKLYLE